MNVLEQIEKGYLVCPTTKMKLKKRFGKLSIRRWG
jgi:hypothetical protein